MKPSERKDLIVGVQSMILTADDVKVDFKFRLGALRQELDDLEKELLDPNSPRFGPFVEAEDVPETAKALDVACNGTGIMERAVGRLERSEFQRMKLTLEFGL